MSNNHDEITLTFKRSDALMLARSLMLAGNAAMMDGKTAAETRLREYAARFMELAPAAARHFGGTTWCQMAMAMSTARDFRVELRSDRSWSSEGYIYITTIDQDGTTRDWRSSDFRHKRGGPDTEAIYEAVKELAAMDVTGSFDPGEEPGFMRSRP